MKEKAYAPKPDEAVHSCVLCDSQAASVTYMGKPVCTQCLKFVKSEF